MVLADVARPEPWHVGQGSSTTMPRPRHAVQGSVIAKRPPVADVCMPLPSQSGHTRGTVPVRAPVPRQSRHAASLVVRSGTVTPSTAWSKLIRTSVSTSAPRRGWPVAPRVRPPPPPKMPPSRSEMSNPPVVVPPPPGKRTPPPAPTPDPNSVRWSSYSLRFSGELSTE